MWGDPISARAAAEECRDLADALGDRFTSWSSRIWLGNALYFLGDLNEAGRVLLRLVEETAATGELFMTFFANVMLGRVRAYQGQPGPARACGKRRLRPRPPRADSRKTSRMRCSPRPPWPRRELAAKEACEASWRHTVPERMIFIRSSTLWLRPTGLR